MFNDFIVPKDLIPSDPRFAVGPSLVNMEYIQRLYETGKELLGTSHRKPQVVDLTKELIHNIKTYFNLPEGHEVLIGNGGATFLFDMIGLGLVKEKSAHFTCGEFSQKWFRAHAKIPWIKTQEFSKPYGEGIDATAVTDADMICVTQNETSTGVQIKSLPDLRQTDSLLAVDATSGAGQIDIDFNLVDLYFFSTQKIFASEGGFFVCIMSPKALKRAKELGEDNSRYIPQVMDWSYCITNSLKAQCFNTPSVSTIFILNEQFKDMLNLSYKGVKEKAQKMSDYIYDWADKHDKVSAFISDISYRSTTVATIDFNKEYNANELVARLRELKVVYDIDSYRKLGRNQIRISLFHNIKFDDLVKLTKIIDLALS